MMTGCRAPRQVDPRLANEMPRKIIWAWERPEDLRFLDPKEFGVAFLAQTLFLENDRVTPNQRRQPLEISPGTYLIAVTRIETQKEMGKRPALDGDMADKVAGLIAKTIELADVKGIQVDFDAASSERPFYRSMMNKLADRTKAADAACDPSDQKVINTNHSPLTTHHSLTMTSLASWCTGDAWFNDFPVDEAVPMVFQMGADSEKIKTYLRNGNDWREPLCRGSYGISIEEGRFEGMKDGRRTFYFKNSAWNPGDIDSLQR
jgi:hypothetical protein